MTVVATVTRATGRLVAVALLPLTIVPIVLVAPRVADEYAMATAEQGGAPALRSIAPALAATSPAGAFRPSAGFRGSIPVLAYHGIDDTRPSLRNVTRQQFAEQMAMLADGGFRTISIEQYARWMRGERVALPARPILLTFDDGRFDAYAGADASLRQHGFRATMFVNTSGSSTTNPFYVRWPEARRMARSGRWDLQVNAHRGHTMIRSGAFGSRGPFYAFRRHTAGHRETWAHYARRVTTDVREAERSLKREIPGYRQWAFATPYGNFGAVRSNDRRAGPFMSRFLRDRFPVVFVARTPHYTRRTSGLQNRHEIHSTTGAGTLYRWLSRNDPGGS